MYTKMADLPIPINIDSLPLENDRLPWMSPTLRLPPAKFISSTPLEDLHSCLSYLRVLYNPEVRGSRRRKKHSVRGNLGINHNPDKQEEEVLKAAVRTRIDGHLLETRPEEIRADAFERSHAIRWLTALISRADEFAMLASDPALLGGSTESNMVMEWNKLIENAAGLLAACAGTAGSGRISRTYTFGPSPYEEYVSFTLIDAPLENEDYASVGAQTWGGACVMADMILENPQQFDLPMPLMNLAPDQQSCVRSIVSEPFGILELGAGTGLAGIAVAKLLQLRNVHADVVLSDFYPSVLANLRSNVSMAVPFRGADECVKVSVTRLDWSSYVSVSEGKSQSEERDSVGTFDLILGADIIYEPEHATWVKSCLEQLLRPNGYFHLVTPLRRTHVVESSTVEEVFGKRGPSDSNAENDMMLGIIERMRFSCDAFEDVDTRFVLDRSNDVDYAFYKIGWKVS